ncbi:acyclic terpene utilization AtuA family protein [Neobacillus sp. FSL H8-0543]|uniref:acyclic terpene utilization AtuA family protein n=1 Tax=Neobacillus sp. FSL H8-0543 TaxID=2954672 RepID=UPI0031597E50
MKKIRIGAATGFYGDSIIPAIPSITDGNIDYLCFDALAELTMAILQKDRQKNPEWGYTKDIGPFMETLLPLCVEKKVKILTNAGGINPLGAKKVVDEIIKRLNLDLKVAVVYGDDMMSNLEELKQNNLLVNMQSKESFKHNDYELLFANAYLGAKPLVEALQQGADIVISGRTIDAAQFAAPMIYEFGWEWDDWDRLAKGMTIGHLMECSGQAVGGNFSGDWRSIDLINIGFPIAEVDELGEAIITKAPGTGGLVSRDTLKEQLLYEVHDPYNYILPDVVVNIADTCLEDIGENQVRVYGSTGKPATDTYKALIGYADGYMAEAIFGYSWPDALEKAKSASEILIAHMERDKLLYEDIDISYIGYNSMHRSVINEPDPDLNEVFLRLAIKVRKRSDGTRLSRIVSPLGLSGPPFLAGMLGRGRATQLLGICPILIPKELVEKQVKVEM